jgi:hypothetical protein
MGFFGVLAACAQVTPEATLGDADLLETAVMGTVDALASLPPMTSTPTPSTTPSLTPTITLTPTQSNTPTPLPPMASVSLATSCRTGPGGAYSLVASLQPRQMAVVTARSTLDNFWYIAVPDQPDEHCWLWGEHASIAGDLSTLPVLTPEPAPVPKMDFIMYHHSFMRCGSLHVSFTVVNNSRTTFQSARIHVEDLDHPDDIHGPAVDRHPFAPSPSFCPPGHSNYFPPGAAAYIVVPISPVYGGNNGLATIKLCTEDWGGGDCVAKLAYFRLPED